MALQASSGVSNRRKAAAPKSKATDIRYTRVRDAGVPKKAAAPKVSAAPAPAYSAPRPAYQAPAATPAPVAAAPAPAPAVTAPVAAPTTPYIDPETWLKPQFDDYFGRIQQDFADRGLLDSTNKMKPMKELADAYTQRLAQERRTDYQNAVNNATNLWEMLTSGELSKAQLMGQTTMNLPAQPSIFSSVFNSGYLPPRKAASGPVGDAPVVRADKGHVIPTYQEPVETLAYKQYLTDKENAAANRAIQSAYLKMAQDSAAKEAEASDPWMAMAGDVQTNRTNALDEIKGNERHPTDLFVALQAAYGIDLEAEILAKNPRAIALVRSAYSNPSVAQAVIDRVMNGGTWKKPVSPAAPQAKAATGAGRDWLTFHPTTTVNWTRDSSNQSYADKLAAQGLGPDRKNR